MTIIKTEKLYKIYQRYEKEPGLKGSIKSLFKRQTIEKQAVQDFDLQIEAGEFVGLIGPNGAGKTTLMKMLTGIIAPSRGDLDVLGFVPNQLKAEYKKQFAIVMGQKSQLFQDLSAADTFLLLKEIYEIEDADYARNLEEFIGLFQIGDYMNVPVRTLSLGERMKLELVAALLHNPKILFLDEPTIGLDAVAQKQIRGFLRTVNRERGTTILLTSHYMDDIRSLCSRCIVINHGSKIYDGSLDHLFARYQTHKVITVEFASETSLDTAGIRDMLQGGGVRIIEDNPFKMTLMVRRQAVKTVIEGMLASCEVEDISIEEEDIGNVVERIYSERGGEQHG